MQRRRPAPQTQTQDLARRFLQLDTGIRLAAAAGGMLPPFVQVDRPESPEQQYPFDAQLHHPKPKPANGPIKIRHIETTAAKTKPVRSVSDPGDAHRLIARFVRTNEEKSRSSTVSAIDPPTPPSPSFLGSSRLAGPSGSGLSQQQRAFPFPSMRRQTTLENFIELESSANETGREDPLALKMGQILARRAAAATRAVSRRRSRSGSISSESRSRMRGGAGPGTRPSSGLSVGFSAEGGAAGEGSGASTSGRVGAVARPRPPPIDVSGSAGVAHGHSKRESVVVDDRSPHDGNSWARAAAGMSVTSAIPEDTNTNVNAEAQNDEETRGRTMSFAASRESLNTFVFPAPAPAPVRQLYAQPNARMQVQVPGSPTQFYVPGTPTSFAMPGSPASFIMTAPESPMSWVMPATPARLVVPPTPTSFVVVPSPTSYVMQTSPTSGVYVSPVESVSGMGMIPGTYQISPTAVFQPSPPRQQAVSAGHFTISPTRQHPISPTRQYPSTPTRRQPSSSSFHTSPTRHTSDAHMNLLRGLSPLPSHGLPLPAPNRPRSFNMLTSSPLAQGSAAPNRFSVAGRMESSVAARAPSPIGRGSPVVHLGSPGLGRVGSPLARVASISPPRASSLTPVPPSTEAPAPPGLFASPLRYAIATPPPAPALSALPAQPSSPSPLPTRVVSPNLPIADPSQILEVFPTREMSPVPSRGFSPLPPRLRHHTNASHPSDGSGSDEVVFRGSSSSAASTPSRRSGRRRVRHHMRSNSEGLARRTMSEDVRSKRTSEVRRTSQALMRRAQTGAGVGDAGDMSSDGRELVVFIPRAPPPPVPAVPTSLSPAPATQYSTPAPVAMVEQPAGPAPPPLVRRESIPLPEAFPHAAATKLGPPPAVSLDVPIQNGTEPLPKPTSPPVEPVQNPTVEPTADPTHKPSIELLRPILEAPAPRRPLAHMPWSPPARVLSRPEMTSREGSFHTAPDSFVEDANVDTDAEFPSSVPGSYPDQSYMDDVERARYIREANGEARYVSTPAHMDLSDLGEGGSSKHSVFTSADEEVRPERATISSATRARVATPTILSRKPSGELIPMPGALSRAPSPPRSATPAKRGRPTEGVLSGMFQPGFLIPPSLAPSPLASSRSGSSQAPHSVRTPNSHAHTASIPMRHDQSYSPPRSGLPRSVTPRTEASFRQPEEDSFHSTHTADPTLRLPLDDWLEFAMSSMAAMGIPLTRSTLEDLHESEDESVAVAEALRRSSLRRYENEEEAEMLDAVSQADEDSEDSLSRSLSDVGSTPSPARSISAHSMFDNQEQGVEMTTFSSVPPEDPSVGMARPTIHTDLPWSPTHNPHNLSSISGVSEVSESEGAMESLQSIAAVVRELSLRTPIPSTTSSQAPRLPSTSGSATRFTPPTGPRFVGGPPSYVGSAPLPGIHRSPTRALSPGSVSITFGEASPALSPVPPLVVYPGDRDRFANNLLMAEHRQLQYPQRHSFHYLRDDDYRALDEGEDVVLFRPEEEWEQIDGRRTRLDSRATSESAVPVDFDGGFDFDSNDPQSRNKYRQFVLSFANALRPPGTNRPPRWVEVALRTLRGQAHGARPRYPSSLFDAIDRVEAGLEALPPPPEVPGHLSSTFITSSSSSASSKSTSLGSALPEDDQIVEDFVRRTLTPQATPPAQPSTPLRVEIDGATAIPWPVQVSPVMPRLRFSRPTSRQTGRTLSITPSSSSGYSSLIPPPPRVRPRSIEPRWLGVYAARQWPIPDTYVSRRTFSSPSALSPPMPYHWRPICHISPQRLWEITNLTIRVDMPPPLPPPVEPSLIESASSVDVRPHFTTPATTYGRATPYSTHSLSTRQSTHHSRRSHSPISVPIPAIYPSAGQMMSHPNLAIDQSPSQPSLPLQNTLSRTSIPLVQRPVDPSFSPRSSIDDARPTPPVASRAMTPAAVSRRRTMKDLVGRLVGKERARTRSITHGRSATPLVGKSRFGFAGKVVDVARRVLRHPRRRTRLSSTRSQRTIRDAT